MQSTQPLDPIFDTKKRTGALATGNSPSSAFVTVTINQGSGQADPTSISPILFDVVFSEAVTGFATGDVDLTASTAGGTLVGTVSGSGAVYTVSVSGMTTVGTVTASINASVCTSISSGMPNSASTSTDNSVAWTAIVSSFIWRTPASAGPPYPGPYTTTTVVTAGQRLLLGTNRVELVVTEAQQPDLFGTTAVLGTITALAASQQYDSSGFVPGFAGVWTATVVTGGTLTISGANLFDGSIQWIMILASGTIAQSATNVAYPSPVTATLPSVPTGPVFSIVHYGRGSTPSSGTPPVGWSSVAHVGGQASYQKYVQIFVGTAQSISYNLGATAVAATSGGRIATIVEITP